jgi:hypothetical protein
MSRTQSVVPVFLIDNVTLGAAPAGKVSPSVATVTAIALSAQAAAEGLAPAAAGDPLGEADGLPEGLGLVLGDGEVDELGDGLGEGELAFAEPSPPPLNSSTHSTISTTNAPPRTTARRFQ